MIDSLWFAVDLTNSQEAHSKWNAKLKFITEGWKF